MKMPSKGLAPEHDKSAEISQYTALYLGLSPKSKFTSFQDLGQNGDNSKWESL